MCTFGLTLGKRTTQPDALRSLLITYKLCHVVCTTVFHVKCSEQTASEVRIPWGIRTTSCNATVSVDFDRKYYNECIARVLSILGFRHWGGTPCCRCTSDFLHLRDVAHAQASGGVARLCLVVKDDGSCTTHHVHSFRAPAYVSSDNAYPVSSSRLLAK
jgi:hypothetical protein